MGAADENKDGKVDADELIHYVEEEVRKATAKKQVPYSGIPEGWTNTSSPERHVRK